MRPQASCGVSAGQRHIPSHFSTSEQHPTVDMSCVPVQLPPTHTYPNTFLLPLLHNCLTAPPHICSHIPVLLLSHTCVLNTYPAHLSHCLSCTPALHTCPVALPVHLSYTPVPLPLLYTCPIHVSHGPSHTPVLHTGTVYLYLSVQSHPTLGWPLQWLQVSFCSPQTQCHKVGTICHLFRWGRWRLG